MLQIILFLGRLLFLALAFYFLYFIVKKTSLWVNTPFETQQNGKLYLSANPGETEIVTPDGRSIAVGEFLEMPSPIRIGRQENNEVIIKDSFVSAQHAIIESDCAAWWLRDLNSKNGILHNGQPVKDRVRLEPNDRLEIAGIEFSWRR
ncbi:MAG TPA: hypothetical protein DHD79_02720 [Firmicutes bacterium]|nr:hypothetical protein [Bacillota bacterium]HAZ21209.1 hypothetical protein [Bacillota bacterium]HBE06626.1 hypothetical protein [Bacillota bacterium]HCX70136.1 hypothetical protein [Bacillota bacterium]